MLRNHLILCEIKVSVIPIKTLRMTQLHVHVHTYILYNGVSLYCRTNLIKKVVVHTNACRLIIMEGESVDKTWSNSIVHVI